MAAYTAIDDAGSFFSLKLWTGNSTTDRAMTGVGFQPDFLWIKGRNEGTDHELQDSVRGSTLYLNSNDDGAEATETEGVKSFDADGYTLGNANYWNWTAKTFVGWSWKAGTTSGVSGGTITPIGYSINTTAGFGIYEYTGNSTSGATIAHGLGVAPKFLITKKISATGNWHVAHQYNSAYPWNSYLYLDTGNGTQEENSATWFLNDTAPDATNITLGDGAGINTTSDYLIYAFAPKQGFSKFGTYEGNGNADGTFVYTGFRPACVLIKGIGGTVNWNMFDTKRPVYNPADPPLWPNSSTAQTDPYPIDILSNGFKATTTSSQVNATTTDPYVYAAFAESPLVNSEGVPSNAR